MNNPCDTLVERLEHLRVKEIDRRGSSETLTNFVHAKAARRPGAPAIAAGRAGSSTYWDSRTANWASSPTKPLQQMGKGAIFEREHNNGTIGHVGEQEKTPLNSNEACRRVLEAWCVVHSGIS